jgi:O-glycosyl hydrolase
MNVRRFATVLFWSLRGLDCRVAKRWWRMRRRDFPAVWMAAVSLLCAGHAGADFAAGVPVDEGDAVVVCGDAGPATSSYVPCLPGSGGDLRSDAKTPLRITIDTSQSRQTIRGFGASDAWSIQVVGQWPEARREAIADLLFETGLDDRKNPEGIGLSAWRFNIGAGSSRQSNISDVWRRADTFLDGNFSGYDWSRCPGQRWFLQAARARGVERFIAFVNSPPVNMTRNGRAYCSPGFDTTNLKADKIEDFAAYLVAILRHLCDVEGIEFEGISPFNEPNWDWNDAGQEGCRYDNSDIRNVVVALYRQLQNQQLDTQIEVPEAGDIGYLYGYPSYRGDYVDAFFNRDSFYYIGDKVADRIASHSYYTCWPEDGRLVDWRRKLRAKLDEYPGLGYAMTEYCILIPNGSWVPQKYRGYGNGRDLGIDPALWVARVIHYDLTVAEASDWQWWLAVSPYDYKDGLVYVDKSVADGGYYESKMLWAMGNFSRFIRPGMTRVVVRRSDNATAEATVEDLMVSAYGKADDGTVVVVFVNRAYEDRPVKLDFPGADIRSLIPYVTRGNSNSRDNLTAYSALGPGDTIAIPARSVVTLAGMATNLGDWDEDAKVDFRDFAVLAARWLGTGGATSGGERPVGWRDLAVWADHWLTDFRLAAHWRLDETAGPVAHDDIGHRDGTLRGGPLWQPAGGVVNGALRLDGADDYVQTPFVLDPAARKFTAFVWVKGGATGQVILSQAGGANWLMAASDGTLTTELKPGGRQGKPLGSVAVITDGAWHRVGLTWDGASRILYVDGVEVGRDTPPGVEGATGGLSIGAGSTLAAGSFWKGLVDDVRIHDRVVKP